MSTSSPGIWTDQLTWLAHHDYVSCKSELRCFGILSCSLFLKCLKVVLYVHLLPPVSSMCWRVSSDCTINTVLLTYVFQPEYRWRDLISQYAHLVHQNLCNISFYIANVLSTQIYSLDVFNFPQSRLNKSGEKTHPCRTPLLIGVSSLCSLSILTVAFFLQ